MYQIEANYRINDMPYGTDFYPVLFASIEAAKTHLDVFMDRHTIDKKTLWCVVITDKTNGKIVESFPLKVHS